MFSTLISNAQTRIAKRKHYNRLVSEIEGLTNRDLIDIGGDRTDMLRHAYRQVYGQ